MQAGLSSKPSRPLPGSTAASVSAATSLLPSCSTCASQSACLGNNGAAPQAQCGGGGGRSHADPHHLTNKSSVSFLSSSSLPSLHSTPTSCAQQRQQPSVGSPSTPAAVKGRRRVRLLEQQRQQEEAKRMRKKKRHLVRLNLSAKMLAGIAALWVLATTLLLTVPESQGILTYLHWVRWPLFRDLTDLVAFRLPHARNIRLRTADGVELGGWHMLPSHAVAAEASHLAPGSRAREEFFDKALGRPAARVVIYFHGNAASRGQHNRVELIKALAATLETHVIAVDYRGYGDSTGWPSEAGLAEDARAVWEWVQERVLPGGGQGNGNGNGNGSSRHTANVYVYGHSLGSSVALGLAHHLSSTATAAAAAAAVPQQPPDEPQDRVRLLPAGLILDAPFTNLSMAALHHPSALPFRLLPFVKQALLHSMYERFPSIDLIADVTQPILILHGRHDRTIPFHLGQELYQAAQLARLRTRPELLEDLWFSEFPYASHNNIYAYPQWTHDMHSFMAVMDGGDTARA